MRIMSAAPSCWRSPASAPPASGEGTRSLKDYVAG